MRSSPRRDRGPSNSADMTTAGAPDRLGPSERLYAGLIRIYPAAFRERYRGEMVRLFADQLREARAGRGASGVLTTWLRTLSDLATSAIGEHLRKDRTVAQSLATFQPTRSMRVLGAVAIGGGVLLLWAFISWDPFADRTVNTIRLAMFWLASIAVAVAFHGRQAAIHPRGALLATGAVVLFGAWNLLWLALAIGRDSPFGGDFGFVGFLAGFGGWLVAAVYGAAMLAMRAAWRGMPRSLATATRAAAVVLVIAGPVATFGMDRLGLTSSDAGGLFTTLGALGVGGVGLGWLVLGVVLLLGGRTAPRDPGAIVGA
jgi:hypothetical protein